MQFSFDIPAEPVAAQRARATLERVSGATDPDVLDTLKLLVTELVTNSIRHCRVPDKGWSIAVSVEVREGVVHVEVSDPGGGFHRDPATPSPLEVSGRGLYLVDQMTDRWGIDNDGKTRVWFDLPAVSE